MPTIRGWGALGAAAALVVLWVAFGEPLLLASAAFLVIAVVFGTWYVRRAAPQVTVTRRISPSTVWEGDRALITVDLVAVRPLSHVHVVDTVDGLGSAEFVADDVRADHSLLGRYEVSCRPRGVYAVGPTDVRIRDPFGVAERGGATGRIDRLVVFPTIEPLVGLPMVRGQDPNIATARSSYSQIGGEDFFTLREYRQGDDLRRIHWPTSARRDRLMIRQLEMPWQSRALIVLDPIGTSYRSPDDFEHAVRGAASILHHLYSSGFSPTLWTGRPSAATVASSASYALAMEELATVAPDADQDLRQSVGRLRQHATGGALVVVTGEPDDHHLSLYQAIGRDYSRTILLTAGSGEGDVLERFRRAGVTTVLCPRGGSWQQAWTSTLEQSWPIATPH